MSIFPHFFLMLLYKDDVLSKQLEYSTQSSQKDEGRYLLVRIESRNKYSVYEMIPGRRISNQYCTFYVILQGR